jgi:uncharacterized RDD family membrane protein YckC
MSRRRHGPDDEPEQPGLFDLPLRGGPGGERAESGEADGGGPVADPHPLEPPPDPRQTEPPAGPDRSEPEEAAPRGLPPLFDPEPVPSGPEPLPRPRPVPEPLAPEPRRPRVAGLRPRLAAVAVDAALHLAVALVGLAGALLLGVTPATGNLPGFALFLLVFSFLYTVVTLAFWGRTPGMIRAGLVARSAGDQPLSFGQTGLRWLAGVATVATLGLPLLLGATGRSLADRWSGSATYDERG